MKDSLTSIEVLSPKGRFEISTAPDCTLADLREKIGQEILQTEPSNISLIARGKIAPVEGSLAEFLPEDSNRRTIFAVCQSQRNKKPPQQETRQGPQKDQKQAPSSDSTKDSTATEAEQTGPSARDRVLALMPEHILEELAEGETRLNDVVSSWERRMRENPEVTIRHLKSRQTQDLLESLKAPMRSKSGWVPSVGEIDTEALMSRPSDRKLMRGSGEISGPQGILRDIQFHNMLTEQLRMPQRGLPEELPTTPPRPSQISGVRVDSKEMDALLQRTENPQVVQAFRQIRGSLRLIQEQEPQLLKALVETSGRSSVPAASGTPEVEGVEAPFTGRREAQSSSHTVDITQPNRSSDTPTEGLLESPQGLQDLQGLQGLQRLLRLREMVSGDGSGGDDSSSLQELLSSIGEGSSFEELESGSDETFKRKYSVQLQHLRDMGFSDEAANLKAIKKTKGNLDAAIDRLNRE